MEWHEKFMSDVADDFVTRHRCFLNDGPTRETGTVLSLACAQCLVGVLASDSNIVARISCALFGMLGLRYLGMGFVAASLLAGSLLPASHPVLLLAVRLVERVVGDLEADALDAQRRGDGWFDYSHAAPRTTRALSTDDLFDQLASTVVSLPAKEGVDFSKEVRPLSCERARKLQHHV
ncbi:hypothetical protein MRX96_002965 [Rhipicephalus microplus]